MDNDRGFPEGSERPDPAELAWVYARSAELTPEDVRRYEPWWFKIREWLVLRFGSAEARHRYSTFNSGPPADSSLFSNGTQRTNDRGII